MEVGTGEKLGGMGGKIRQDLLGTTEAYNPEVTIATLCNKTACVQTSPISFVARGKGTYA